LDFPSKESKTMSTEMENKDNGTSAKKHDDHVGCAVVALFVVGGIYYYLDEAIFATRRPWNLLVFLAAVSAAIASLFCLVLVLIRMFHSEKDRPLGVVAGLLLPFCGLGAMMTFVWGWFQATRKDANNRQEQESLAVP
jgi:hypothetical protein